MQEALEGRKFESLAASPLKAHIKAWLMFPIRIDVNLGYSKLI